MKKDPIINNKLFIFTFFSISNVLKNLGL